MASFIEFLGQMDLKSDVICGIHTSSESCKSCEVFNRYERSFIRFREARRRRGVEAEEFIKRTFQEESNQKKGAKIK